MVVKSFGWKNKNDETQNENAKVMPIPIENLERVKDYDIIGSDSPPKYHNRTVPNAERFYDHDPANTSARIQLNLSRTLKDDTYDHLPGTSMKENTHIYDKENPNDDSKILNL